MSAHEVRIARRKIEEDPLAFDHPIFRIDPPTGEIFPNSFCELTVAFRPLSAGDLTLTAYCELTGREERLPLQLQGQGLGPKATWLYESLDIGDVYINSEHRCAVLSLFVAMCLPSHIAVGIKIPILSDASSARPCTTQI